MEDQANSPMPPAVAPIAARGYSLFDPVAVGIATFLGAPLGGSIVMALNYRRLGRKRTAVTALMLGTLLTGLVLFLGMAASTDAVRAVPIACIMAMFYAAKSYQGPAVEEHRRLGGRLASRWAAAGIGTAVLIPLLGIIITYVVVDSANSRIIVGTKDEVQFSGAATAADARLFGEALQSVGYFRDQGVTALLAKDQTGYTISFVVKDGFWADAAHVELFETIGRQVAPAVGGLPLKLRLVNSMLESKKEVTLQ